MNLEKYTERARGFVQSAQSLALREDHQQFTPEHVLKVAARRRAGPGGRPDRPARAGARATRSPQVELALAKLPKVEGSGAGQLYLDPATARLFDNAEKIAQKAGDSLRHRRAPAARAGDGEGERGGAHSRQRRRDAADAQRGDRDLRKGRTADSASAENAYDALKKYARDLTEAARGGQARSGDRPRRGNPPHHAGAVAAHQEQSRC